MKIGPLESDFIERCWNKNISSMIVGRVKQFKSWMQILLEQTLYFHFWHSLLSITLLNYLILLTTKVSYWVPWDKSLRTTVSEGTTGHMAVLEAKVGLHWASMSNLRQDGITLLTTGIFFKSVEEISPFCFPPPRISEEIRVYVKRSVGKKGL